MLLEPPRLFPFSKKLTNWQSSDSSEFNSIQTMYAQQLARNRIRAGSHCSSAACSRHENGLKVRATKFPRGLSDFSARSTRKSEKKHSGNLKMIPRQSDDTQTSTHRLNVCHSKKRGKNRIHLVIKNKTSPFYRTAAPLSEEEEKDRIRFFTDDCQISTQTAQTESDAHFVSMTQVVLGKETAELQRHDMAVATAKLHLPAAHECLNETDGGCSVTL